MINKINLLKRKKHEIKSILLIILLVFTMFSIFSTLLVKPVKAQTSDEYFIYSRYDPPGINDVTAVGSYVEYFGVPEWGDEIQYIYFLSGYTGYKVRVRVTDGDGDGKIEPRQHPDHYISEYIGPIEPRNYEIVSSSYLAPYTYGSGGHSEEFYIDSSGVYLGAYPLGIYKWDHDWNYIGKIANTPPVRTESMAYNAAENTWYAGGRYRNIYELRDTDGDGSFLDESWVLIFTYPNYGGDHHDGMEYVGGYLWISDMTSDVIGKWQYNPLTNSWEELRRFTYSEPASVEGMGFGANDHFWCGSGWGSISYFYELGNEITKGYPLANAGLDVDAHPPTIPVQFDASGSHHTDPTKNLILYEWDFDNDGIWDYSGTALTVEYTYPAYYNPDGSIDWVKTAKDYTVTLRVTDDSDPTLRDSDTCIVQIAAPPWKPVADPNGPYEGYPNIPIVLDASGSYDPESQMFPLDHPWYETIADYEWDLDNDGEFDDATGINPLHIWENPGLYTIALKVTDQQASGPGGVIGPLDIDIKYSTVVINPDRTFAIITDLHIGRGYKNYNEEDYYLTDRLTKIVEEIINNKNKIKFVMVLGDLSEHGELEELLKAQEILSELNLNRIPYFPVLGNHDHRNNFKQVFTTTFLELQFNLLDIEDFEIDATEYINYAFNYQHLNFIILDYSIKTIPGIGNPIGVSIGKTNDFLIKWLKKFDDALLFTHYPLVRWVGFDPFIDAITAIEYAINAEIENGWDKVLANFAGHTHGFYDSKKEWNPWTFEKWDAVATLLTINPFGPVNPIFYNANAEFPDPDAILERSPGDIKVITTEALMVGSNQQNQKGIIRLVKISNGELTDYNQFLGTDDVLNPYLKIITKPKIEKQSIFRYNYKLDITIEAYAFTRAVNKLQYIILWDGEVIYDSIHETDSKIAFTIEKDIELPLGSLRLGTFKLIVNGWENDGGVPDITEEISKFVEIPHALFFGFFSPVEVSITDPIVRIFNSSISQIPDSFYEEIDINGDGFLDEAFIILNPLDGDYIVQLEGTADGSYSQFSGNINSQEVIMFNAYDIPISINELHQYIFDWDALSRGEEGTSLLIDENGDGEFEREIIADTDLTYSEFTLQTETTIDFDPNVLNLNSKGEWVTVYIELPEGFDVNEIDIETILLNGQINAELTPSEIGDFDQDGILEIMVKFDRNAVEEELHGGENIEITITGRLYDGRLFKGVDIIRVIDKNQENYILPLFLLMFFIAVAIINKDLIVVFIGNLKFIIN